MREADELLRRLRSRRDAFKVVDLRPLVDLAGVSRIVSVGTLALAVVAVVAAAALATAATAAA